MSVEFIFKQERIIHMNHLPSSNEDNLTRKVLIHMIQKQNRDDWIFSSINVVKYDFEDFQQNLNFEKISQMAWNKVKKMVKNAGKKLICPWYVTTDNSWSNEYNFCMTNLKYNLLWIHSQSLPVKAWGTYWKWDCVTFHWNAVSLAFFMTKHVQRLLYVLKMIQVKIFMSVSLWPPILNWVLMLLTVNRVLAQMIKYRNSCKKFYSQGWREGTTLWPQITWDQLIQGERDLPPLGSNKQDKKTNSRRNHEITI